MNDDDDDTYHVFQNYFYTFSRLVCLVDTLRDQIERIFGRRFTDCRARTWGGGGGI